MLFMVVFINLTEHPTGITAMYQIDCMIIFQMKKSTRNLSKLFGM